MSKEKIFKTMDGNEAAAYASYAFTEVSTIYPITPSSPMADHVDDWAAHGKKNLFGQPVQLVELQAESGACGALHGALETGSLATTYTASQGQMLMIPPMFRIAGSMLPGVMHVSARTVGTHSISIFGDQSDVMACRQTGWAQLASASVQECMDLGVVAHLSAIKGSIPFQHFFDGFRTSHEIQKIEVLDYEDLRALVDWDMVKQFKDHALNSEHPTIRSTLQNPDTFFQSREACNTAYEALPEIVQAKMDAINALTGRDYKLFNYYGAPDAERVVIAMGSVCETLREVVDYLCSQGEKVGMVQVHLYRPFSARHLLAALPASVQVVSVLDRTKEPGSAGEPLYADVCTAVDAGLNHAVEIAVPAAWADLKDEEAVVDPSLPTYIREIQIPVNKQQGDRIPVSAFMPYADGVTPVETSKYERRGIATNVPKWIPENCIGCNMCSLVCPHAAIRPFLLTPEDEANAPEGLATKPALGKGLTGYSFRIQVDPVDCQGCSSCANVCLAKDKALVMEPLESTGDEALKAALQEWLEKGDDPSETRRVSDALKAALAATMCESPDVKFLQERTDALVKKTMWMYGGDGWAYDIGYGGLDHVLASGIDVNILVVDTEVYSNTGGQASKATSIGAVAQFANAGKSTAKKDLGRIAMAYDNVYVAKVAMGANPAQLITALKEAEAHKGPSLIIAYAPCINHGLVNGMGKAQAEEKLAVECGYWPLFRYIPENIEKGKNPFVLDSKEPNGKLREFMMGEVRFSALTRTFPERAEVLFAEAEEFTNKRYALYKSMAE